MWETNNFQTLHQYLEWYNSRDVTGFVEVLENMLSFYHEKELDPFKDSVSLPGIVEHYLFKGFLQDHIFLES